MNPPKSEQGLIIPHEKMSPEALQGLIEEVVTRNGTDNGHTRSTLEQNVAMIIGQLRRKEVVVLYDESTQTANIVPAEYLRPSPAPKGSRQRGSDRGENAKTPDVKSEGFRN